MSKKLRKKSVSQFEHSFLGHVVFWGLFISISSAIFISNTSMNINKDFENGVILSFLIYPLLGVIVCWKNSDPEKDGIFSKLKSLFTPGLWYSVLSAILLITGAIFSENGVNISTYLFMGGALLSMLMSIGNNMRTNYSYKRGFGDALAMSMGQLIIVFLLLIILGAITQRFHRR
jgi:hypothetical protein